MKDRPLVRPWALAGPVLVLLICLPLLRPLRHPLEIADDEATRLATVQSLVESRTLAIATSRSSRTGDRFQKVDAQGIRRCYSDQPPALAALLAAPYWCMYHAGLTFDRNAPLVAYVLTILGVTLPVALSAGLVYRMGRIFELQRPWRAALGAATVLATGLVSYSTVLNAQAPAAVLLLASANCLIHVSNANSPIRSSAWLTVAGLCAALAAVIDLPAAVFTLLLAGVILTLRWPISLRLGGMVLYVIGMVPPLVLHAALTVPLTGDLLPPRMHGELVEDQQPFFAGTATDMLPAAELQADLGEQENSEEVSWVAVLKLHVIRLLGTLLGANGVFSHFPVLLVSLLGVGAVMHRNWPASTKSLAVATVAGSAAMVLACVLTPPDWPRTMFAARWFIVFSPLLFFWTGAWLRRRHRPASWGLAAALCALSVTVSLIGALHPCPREGCAGYSAAATPKPLVHSAPSPAT